MDNKQLEVLLSQFLEHKDRSDLRDYFNQLVRKQESTQTSTINTITLSPMVNTHPTTTNPVNEDALQNSLLQQILQSKTQIQPTKMK